MDKELVTLLIATLEQMATIVESLSEEACFDNTAEVQIARAIVALAKAQVA